MTLRRPFARSLLTAVLVLTLGAVGGPVTAQPGFQTTEVAPGLYSFGNGFVYNAFMVTDDGVIVMDSIDEDFATASLSAIREVTDEPIRYLVYSHNHYDHISGGDVFKAEGAKILSHEAAADWLAAHPSPAVAMPDETWSGSESTLELGGSLINLRHFGANHGEGMTVFEFPEEKTIFTVDLVVPERVGFAYMPDFFPAEWERTLTEMMELDFEQVMFSHNAAVGPAASVTDQLAYLQDLRGAIFAEFEAGTPFAEIPDTVELPQYETWAGYEEWLPMNVWRVMLEIAMGV